MLFQGLNKLKTRAIMASIILMAAGVIIVICPVSYIEALIDLMGIVMLIAAIVMILDFLSSQRSLINFILLTVALILGIVGGVILILDLETIYVLAWIFGIALILWAVYSAVGALVFARRSGRKAWWVLLILSALLLLFGLIVINNPFWNTPGELLKIIGLMVIFSAIVSALRLIWIWPIRSE